MGRTTAKRVSRTAVVGPTPSSANAPFGAVQKQQRRQAMDDDVAMHQLQDKDGPTQPAKVTVNKFFTAVPRTAILENEGADAGPVIKKDTAAPPVNLGEISAAIWANTSVRKGGAKGPSERASVTLTMLLDEKAVLDEGGSEAALMSTNGLLAYAQGMIWGVRMPGEADDAPFDPDDPLQVAGRLKVLWKDWRKLPQEQQKAWGDKQLAHQAAAALKRAMCGSSKPKAKLRRAAASVSTAEHDLAVPVGQSRGSRRKPDGWSYVPPPQQRSEATKAQLKQMKEVEEEEDEEAEMQQEARKGKKKAAPAASKRKGGGSAAAAAVDEGHGNGDAAKGSGDVGRAVGAGSSKPSSAAFEPDDGAGGGTDEQEFDDRFRRAAALAKHNKKALLAEMKIWEDEAQEQEQAAAAGFTVEELRRRKKGEAAAALARDDTLHPDDAAGTSSKAAAAKRKAGTEDSKQRSKAGAGSKRARKQRSLPEEDLEDSEAEGLDAEPAGRGELERRQRGSRQAAAAACKKMSAASALQDDEDEDELDAADLEDALEGGEACAADKLGSKKTSGKEKPAKSKVASQQPSPSRRSFRTVKPEVDDGPAASGAGGSPGPRRGRSASAGGAAVAQLDHLEKTLFSNTRRSSYGRADSPGLVALAATAHRQPTPDRQTAGGGSKAASKRGSSRMKK
eukprot:gene4245-4495_t